MGRGVTYYITTGASSSQESTLEGAMVHPKWNHQPSVMSQGHPIREDVTHYDTL